MRAARIVGSLLAILCLVAGHEALAGENAKRGGWESVKYQPVFWPGPPGPHPGPMPHPPGPHPYPPGPRPYPPRPYPPGPGVIIVPPVPVYPRVVVDVSPPPPAAVYVAPTPATIRITNPATNTAVLSYTLNGYPYTIAPGQVQTLNQTSIIEINRGGTLGVARYSLTDGTYTFMPTADGSWDLYRTAN